VPGGLNKRLRTLAGPFFVFAGAMRLAATAVAVLPADIGLALHAERYPKTGSHPARTALWARLPLQAVFIAWVLGAAQEKEFGA
jgi:uncharacterized membrane protein